MRAKYINKTARRRSVRPDGGSYRELRKMRGGGLRSRGPMVTVAAMIGLGLGVAWIAYAMFLRS